MIRHLTYLLVLAGCLAGASWLELWPGTAVFRRLRRLARAVLPVFAIFTAWDVYAIARHQWTYDPTQLVGIRFPGALPLEEVLFFLVVPTCAVLAFEAVRKVTGWPDSDAVHEVTDLPESDAVREVTDLPESDSVREVTDLPESDSVREVTRWPDSDA